MSKKKQTLEQRVLIMFKNSSLGLTDDELVRYIPDVNPGTIKMVRCRCLTAGELVADGTTRVSRAGRMVRVHKYTGNMMKERDKKSSVVPVKAAKKNEARVDKSANIREAIGGLLSIIKLIETQLPHHLKKKN